MLMGIKYKANPTEEQKLILSQWMGCSKVIWNAKCEEEKYLSTYARKYLPIGTYPEVDTKFSQYKNNELTPWLSKCPSQLLRNSATNWYKTYWKTKWMGCTKRCNLESCRYINCKRRNRCYCRIFW